MLLKPIIPAVCLCLLLTGCFRSKEGGLSSDPTFAAPDTFTYDAKTDPFVEKPKVDSADPVAALYNQDFRFFISECAGKFRHRELKAFERCAVKDLNNPIAITEQHEPVTRVLAYKVFQDHVFVPHIFSETTKVLYSIQEEKKHQGILIAGMDDDWVDRIYYYSYTPDGKFIAKSCLYECGGDGGSYSETFGRFINDSTYLRTSISRDPVNEDPEKFTYDSTVSRIIIHSNGRISESKN